MMRHPSISIGGGQNVQQSSPTSSHLSSQACAKASQAVIKRYAACMLASPLFDPSWHLSYRDYPFVFPVFLANTRLRIDFCYLKLHSAINHVCPLSCFLTQHHQELTAMSQVNNSLSERQWQLFCHGEPGSTLDPHLRKHLLGSAADSLQSA